jgi:hypothetical protein
LNDPFQKYDWPEAARAPKLGFPATFLEGRI